MLFELFLASLGSLSVFGMIVSVASGIALGALTCGYICADVDGNDEHVARAGPMIKRVAPVFLGAAAIASVPSVDALWRVRIGLIKLQLASPANVEKGAEAIERIAHKLECKYVGCEEEKKP